MNVEDILTVLYVLARRVMRGGFPCEMVVNLLIVDGLNIWVIRGTNKLFKI